MQRFPMTVEGLKKITEELEELKSVQRPIIINAISEAREHGDLSENAEYSAAKERQSFNETRIMELEDKIARADIIDVSKLSGNTVTFGATVTLIDVDSNKQSKYTIVGDCEANIEARKISISSPTAKALIGKNKGEFIEVNTPAGVKEYEIVEVQFV